MVSELSELSLSEEPGCEDSGSEVPESERVGAGVGGLELRSCSEEPESEDPESEDLVSELSELSLSEEPGSEDPESEDLASELSELSPSEEPGSEELPSEPSELVLSELFESPPNCPSWISTRSPRRVQPPTPAWVRP